MGLNFVWDIKASICITAVVGILSVMGFLVALCARAHWGVMADFNVILMVSWHGKLSDCRAGAPTHTAEFDVEAVLDVVAALSVVALLGLKAVWAGFITVLCARGHWGFVYDIIVLCVMATLGVVAYSGVLAFTYQWDEAECLPHSLGSINSWKVLSL